MDNVPDDSYSQKLKSIIDGIALDFKYDRNLVFADTFDRISGQLRELDELIQNVNKSQENYWIVYNIINSSIPVFERLIFAGYSDQILSFCLNMNRAVSENLVLITSKYLPFRLRVFCTVCTTFANTKDNTDKDAGAFITSFKNDLTLYKQLEENNINGLNDTITVCTGDTVSLDKLYDNAFRVVELVSVHFIASNELDFEKISSKNQKPKSVKGKSSKEQNEQQQNQVPPIEKRIIELLANSYNPSSSKSDFTSKYSSVIGSWASQECSLGPALLHRLLYIFLKSSGTIDNLDSLKQNLGDDPIVVIADLYQSGKWVELSKSLYELDKDQISDDYVLFTKLAIDVWSKYDDGTINDPEVLQGVLNILVNSPGSCPLQVSLVALKLAWHFDGLKKHDVASRVSLSALDVLEDFRDILTTRKFDKILSTNKMPNKPLDQSFLSFEKWLMCMHVDLLCIYIRSRLKHGLACDTEKAYEQYSKELQASKDGKANAEHIYGSLTQKQKIEFEEKINKKFKPPSHAKEIEDELMETFGANSAVKAILYLQMSFFRPKKAQTFLGKAMELLEEMREGDIELHAPLLYVNRTGAAFVYQLQVPGTKKVSLLGKVASHNSVGLTLSNTGLPGTGVKQDPIEPFVVTNLKKDTLYSFAFASYNSNDELVDAISTPFLVTTCHTLYTPLIWAYIASASYQTKDMLSFDASLTKLISIFADVAAVPVGDSFFKNTNPFNRFSLKESILTQPAPMLRAFSSTLLMAARLFSSKPLHSTSFQKLALEMSQILGLHDLTLKICHEIYSVLEPAISNIFHSKWTMSPLLFVLNALKWNKQTENEQSHMNLLAKVSFAIDAVLATLYQEKQLAQFVLNSVVESSANQFRSSFMMFAAKYHILEQNSNEQVLPYSAADIYRSSPDKAYDELFSKFKADPHFLQAATYLVACAHNDGCLTQGLAWSNQCLEYLKLILSDSDAASLKKKEKKGESKPVRGKTSQSKSRKSDKSKSSSQMSQIDTSQTQDVTKIQNAWIRYSNRKSNLAKFYKANKYRAALNMLQAMCIIDSETYIAIPTNNPTDKNKSKGRSSQLKKKADAGKHEDEGDKSNPGDQTGIVLTFLKRAIVLAERTEQYIIMRAVCNLISNFLHNITPESSSISGSDSVLENLTTVLASILPFNEKWAIKTFEEVLMCEIRNGVDKNIKFQIKTAVDRYPEAGSLVWVLSGCQIPEELTQAVELTQNRDPTENMFSNACTILDRYQSGTAFSPNGSKLDISGLTKVIDETVVSLQNNQRLLPAISLLRRLSFCLFTEGDNETALQKLQGALEFHFKVVNIHEKVDQIIIDEPENVFYKKYSWSGCISIFTMCSLIAMHSEKSRAMMLSKLASHAISSLFTCSPYNPTKAIDFINFEPSEIVPGIDIFSDMDNSNRMLEPIPPKFLSIAIMNNISSLLSFEMYYELFKPLSFARHYFRYIVRNKNCLVKARLMTVRLCAEFGFIKQAVEVFNDILSQFGYSSKTREFNPSSPDSKKLQFNENEPFSSPTNFDSIRYISSQQMVTHISTTYGFSIGCLYTICISRVLQAIYEASDPGGSGLVARSEDASQTGKNTKKRQQSKKDRNDFNDIMSGGRSIPYQSLGAFEATVKFAESLVMTALNGNFDSHQLVIKAELMLELAYIKLNQWSWEKCIENSYSAISEIERLLNEEIKINQNISESSMLLPFGISQQASSFISRASFNLHDLVTAEKYGSPYMKSLILIHKADLDSASFLLSQIALSKPVTMFYREYVLSVAQLVTLLIYNKKLIDSCKARHPPSIRGKINPVQLITELVEKSINFFIESFGMYSSENKYLLNTHLLVRIMYLQAISEYHFSSVSDSLETLKKALDLMTKKCPFVSRGLKYLIVSASTGISMQEFVSSHPTVLQFWNKEMDPLKTSPELKYSPEFVSSLLSQMVSLFEESPEFVIHPLSNQASLDMAVLTGLASNDDDKRLTRSLAALTMSYATRISKRFVQSLISTTNDVPPTSAPLPLINDNKDCSMRGLAAAYFSHICELDLPIFDTSLLELRSQYFFKTFEEQCSMFKYSVHLANASNPETGTVAGQWYLIDTKSFNVKNESKFDDGVSSEAGKSTVTLRSSISKTTTTTRSSAASGKQRIMRLLKGSLFFFIGISVESEESRKLHESDKTIRLTPLIFVGSPNDLKSISDDMAEIGLLISEVMASETIEAYGSNKKDDDKKDKKAKADKKIKTEVEKPQLKGQSAVQMKDAETRWMMSVHKVDAAFVKSVKIISTLCSNLSRWPTELKVSSLDLSNAIYISHLFNTQFGMNDKTGTLSDWLAGTPVPQPESQTSAR